LEELVNKVGQAAEEQTQSLDQFKKAMGTEQSRGTVEASVSLQRVSSIGLSRPSSSGSQVRLIFALWDSTQPAPSPYSRWLDASKKPSK